MVWENFSITSHLTMMGDLDTGASSGKGYILYAQILLLCAPWQCIQEINADQVVYDGSVSLHLLVLRLALGTILLLLGPAVKKHTPASGVTVRARPQGSRAVSPERESWTRGGISVDFFFLLFPHLGRASLGESH